MTTPETRSEKTPSPGSSLSEMYGEYLSDVPLTDEEAEAFLAALYHVMRCFVDVGLGVPPLDKMLIDSLTDDHHATRDQRREA